MKIKVALTLTIRALIDTMKISMRLRKNVPVYVVIDRFEGVLIATADYEIAWQAYKTDEYNTLQTWVKGRCE